MRFNRSARHATRPAGRIEQPTLHEVRATQSLWQAPLEVAAKYGGPLTRAAISAASIRGDRKHVMVDTKVHMLMPGFYPAIPGWHTDGAPRGDGLDGRKSGAPKLHAQEFAAPPRIDLQEGQPENRYHTLVTGSHCLTEFMAGEVDIDIPEMPTNELYGILNSTIEASNIGLRVRIPSCTMFEFDWWDLHRAMPSTGHEWRFFCRITETDYWPPASDLDAILRTQQQVYMVGASYGW